MIPRLSKFISESRELGVPSVWIRWEPSSDFYILYPSKLFELNFYGVAPKKSDIVVTKRDEQIAFKSTDLNERLRKIGITRLLFSGVYANLCVRDEAAIANRLGYKCLIIEDLVVAIPNPQKSPNLIFSTDSETIRERLDAATPMQARM